MCQTSVPHCDALKTTFNAAHALDNEVESANDDVSTKLLLLSLFIQQQTSR